MPATVNEVVGARVAHLRRSNEMSQGELIRQLEPFIGSAWSRQNLGSGENGRRTWTAEEALAIAVIFDVPLTELFTPMPEQSGDLRTSGNAVISRKVLMRHIAQPSTVPTPDISDLVRASEMLTTKIRDVHAIFEASTEEDGPDGVQQGTD